MRATLKYCSKNYIFSAAFTFSLIMWLQRKSCHQCCWREDKYTDFIHLTELMKEFNSWKRISNISGYVWWGNQLCDDKCIWLRCRGPLFIRQFPDWGKLTSKWKKITEALCLIWSLLKVQTELRHLLTSIWEVCSLKLCNEFPRYIATQTVIRHLLDAPHTFGLRVYDVHF